MPLQEHMTLVNGVAIFFFDGILLCGWRLPDVSMVVRLIRYYRQTSNSSTSKDASLLPRPERDKERVRTEPKL